MLVIGSSIIKEVDMRNPGMILLAVWLILTGLVSLTGWKIPSSELILALLALVAGALILLGLRGIKLSRHLGTLLLAIYLLVVGLAQLVGLSFRGSEQIMAVLALASGVLLLLNR
jgi:hypothetical protein